MQTSKIFHNENKNLVWNSVPINVQVAQRILTYYVTMVIDKTRTIRKKIHIWRGNETRKFLARG